MYKEPTERKHKEDGSEDRKPWEEHRETVQTSRVEVRKPKAQSANKSIRNVEDNNITTFITTL